VLSRSFRGGQLISWRAPVSYPRRSHARRYTAAEALFHQAECIQIHGYDCDHQPVQFPSCELDVICGVLDEENSDLVVHRFRRELSMGVPDA
jgi:hypothetical protein